MQNKAPSRSRLVYGIAAAMTVALGLLWRSRFLPLPTFLAKYGGDALWAALVFALTRFCQPRMGAWSSVAVALGISVAVEISQLYHAPWIDAVRHTRLGALALGGTFNWPDIPAYAVGVAMAAVIDRVARPSQVSSASEKGSTLSE